ncbi:MAG: anthranilate phosphoribosyltransferase [Acidobacteriota bacterium]
MADNTLRAYLPRLVRREDLSRDEAGLLLEALLDQDSTDAQVAAVLVALAAKGETVEELAGMAIALRGRAVRIDSQHRTFIDTAGTGSSSAKTFNVSTAATFVIAAAGLPVAKHGNRAASSRSGSADVLNELGIRIDALPEISQRSLNEINICFMFAPLYHRATARVASVRRELGIPTAFNLLGPLSNPAGAPRQIIGVSRRDLVTRMAKVLAALDVDRAWVVHGEDGLDEITVAANTFVAEAQGGTVRTFEIEPKTFGLWRGSLEHLRGGDARANAQIIREVLSGKRRDEARALVIANAAAALFVGGVSASLLNAARKAEESIDSGAALKKLAQLVEATNQRGDP